MKRVHGTRHPPSPTYTVYLAVEHVSIMITETLIAKREQRKKRRNLKSGGAQKKNDEETNQIPNSERIQDLLQENTILKKSISNFRNQVQKQTEQWHSMMVARSQSTIFTPGTTPTQKQPKGAEVDSHLAKRVSELEATTHKLYLRLEEKEREIEELMKYKKRYEKIIQNARKKKKTQNDHPE